MKVKELRAFLKNLPPSMDEAIVILQRDPEGNGYSPLQGGDEDSVYDEDENYVYSCRHTAQENCLDPEKWEEMKNDPTKKAVVLWPRY